MLKKEDFLEYQKQGYNRIPIYKQVLADIDTPVSIYLKLANQTNGYLLESVYGGEQWGRYSFIGLPAKTHIESKNNHLKVMQNGEVIEEQENAQVLDFVQEFSDRFTVPDIAELPRFSGGLVGHLGYPVIHEIEPKLKTNKNTKHLYDVPDVYLILSEDLVIFDNINGHIMILSYINPEQESYEDGVKRIDEIERKIHDTKIDVKHATNNAGAVSERDINYHFDKDDYCKVVEKCKEYIKDGDIFQVVPSQIMSMDFDLPPVQLYRALRTVNPSPYMYCLNLGDFHIVGCSPELLVRVENKEITVRPIAGTRHRGATPEEDLALENELMADKKEIAEHLMLIDLGRNDVGRVAKGGSINVEDYMIIEKYSHVMHIVSNVKGIIRENMSPMDVFKATFPAGTLSGAPKIRALEIIEEVEPHQRSIYSGAVGYLGWNNNLDMAIAIRTAVIKDKKLYVQSGGGLVADSVPESEWEEAMNKAQAVVKGVNIAYNYFNE